MNKLEAKIFLLEDLLMECEHTISFLHNCLSDTEEFQYKYEYPEQTIKVIQKLQKTIKYPKYCHHSIYNKNCEACNSMLEYRKKLEEARNANI